ncbi:uncharacterized protein LOC126841851 isoform X2 [Adelges cooleyi]|uniref:uncharacterized protein LOC126841851 isoform X2 n=1 Tax=Adelges cooleyi TaxID=133065 RepID=UPI00217FA9FD|nr:uncharacterized protein LOC126841851 isoform X2 [Adelges cooleyi]
MAVEIKSTYHTPLIAKDVPTWRTYQTQLNNLGNLHIAINHEEENKETTVNGRLTWRDLFPQVFASVIAFMLVVQPGINMTYSNILLRNINISNSSQYSWLTSMLVLCTPIGAVLIGVIMDRIGRKKACLLTCVPLLIAWSIASIATIFPDHIGLFYACRVFAGIGGGMTTVSLVYVSEIAMSSYKQVLLSLNSVFLAFGILFAVMIGHTVPWPAINVVFLIFTVVTMLLIAVFLPESPSWIVKFRSEDVRRAKGSLKTIYPNNNKLYSDEWDRLNVPPAIPLLFKSTLARRLSPRVLRPVGILAVMFLLQQLSGCYPVIFYAVPVFKSIVPDGQVDEMNTLVTFGMIRFFVCALTCALSLHVGRRPLMMISSVGMACSSLLVAATYKLNAPVAAGADGPPPPEPSVWDFHVALPLTGIMMFVCSSSLGALVFPWTLVSELLPTSDRATAGGFLISYAYIIMFFVLKMFPVVFEAVSVPGVFTVFAVASLAMAVHVYAALPETLGKHFFEIEDYFAKDYRPFGC